MSELDLTGLPEELIKQLSLKYKGQKELKTEKPLNLLVSEFSIDDYLIAYYKTHNKILNRKSSYSILTQLKNKNIIKSVKKGIYLK